MAAPCGNGCARFEPWRFFYPTKKRDPRWGPRFLVGWGTRITRGCAPRPSGRPRAARALAPLRYAFEPSRSEPWGFFYPTKKRDPRWGPRFFVGWGTRITRGCAPRPSGRPRAARALAPLRYAFEPGGSHYRRARPCWSPHFFRSKARCAAPQSFCGQAAQRSGREKCGPTRRARPVLAPGGVAPPAR